MRDGALIYRSAFVEGLKPDPDLTVSQWADRYRMLSNKASAEPGPWRTDRTPYLREIMDCMSANSAVQKVVFMAGAQLGKTEGINNVVGYMIAHAPGPALFVQPTIEMAKRLSKQRLDSLIHETPCLAEKIAPARSRDSGNTMFSKEFPGGITIITCLELINVKCNYDRTCIATWQTTATPHHPNYGTTTSLCYPSAV